MWKSIDQTHKFCFIFLGSVSRYIGDNDSMAIFYVDSRSNRLVRKSWRKTSNTLTVSCRSTACFITDLATLLTVSAEGGCQTSRDLG